MSLEEFKKQQEEAKANGYNCMPYPECVNRVEQTQEQVKNPETTQAEQTSTPNTNIQTTAEAEKDTGVFGITTGNNNTDILVIIGVVGIVIIVLLGGILSALNKIAKKKN